MRLRCAQIDAEYGTPPLPLVRYGRAWSGYRQAFQWGVNAGNDCLGLSGPSADERLGPFSLG